MNRRVITGVVLAVSVGLATYYAPRWGFATLALMVFLLAFWEAARLLRLPKRVGVGLGMLLVAGAGELYFAPVEELALLCLVGSIWWCGIGIWLFRTDHAAAAGKKFPKLGQKLAHALQCVALALFAWTGLLLMHRTQGAAVTLAMLVVIFCADVCAYWCGKSLGYRPLAKTISPGKTVEGLEGALMCTTVVAMWVFGSLGLDVPRDEWWIWFVATWAAILFGVLGDLFESALKRRAGLKDSGGLLPGHGGVYDRIDGLFAAAPVFALLIWEFN